MWGLEAEVSASPIEGLDIDGSLSWIDGEWNRISAQVTSIKLTDPITSPNWRGSFGIQYKADLGGKNGTLTPRFDLAYTGKQQIGRLTVASPLEYNPAFAIANARLTWKIPAGSGDQL
jgi:iron complex outermembrane receptor protein